MASLRNRIVLITGASSGIGGASARAFAAEGAHLILAARRTQRIEALCTELQSEHGIEALPVTLDVRDRNAVAQAIAGLPKRFQTIDVLLNNAGLSRGMSKLHEGALDDWDEMIDTNVKGLLYVTRAVLPGMVARGRGHIINLGSLAGREAYAGGNVYCATKSAVAVLTRGMRLDLNGTGVRVTNIEPGMVETEFSLVRFHGDEARAAGVYRGIQPLTAGDIAEAILWVATRPEHINVQDMLLMPTAQASAGVSHRTA